jgi:hypothetical protein
MYGISRDRELMGDYAAGGLIASAYIVAMVVIGVCIVALGVLSARS